MNIKYLQNLRLLFYKVLANFNFEKEKCFITLDYFNFHNDVSFKTIYPCCSVNCLIYQTYQNFVCLPKSQNNHMFPHLTLTSSLIS